MRNAETSTPTRSYRLATPEQRLSAGQKFDACLLGSLAITTAISLGMTGDTWKDYASWYIAGPTTEEQLIHNHLKDSFGKPVVVRCKPVKTDGDSAAHGDTVIGQTPLNAITYGPFNIIRIRPDACGRIASFSKNPAQIPTWKTMIALNTAVHEYRHTDGERHEGRTECWAAQRTEDFAMSLGAPRAVAEEIGIELAIRPHANNPEYALPAECKDDGPLDLHPGKPGALRYR